MLEADVEVDRREFTVRADLRVAAGERLALFGPSGAGKTTLLEVIAGLVRPRRARIVLGGRVLTSTSAPARAVPPWQRRVGLLRQDPGLFPHLSVRGNLGYAPAADPGGAQLTELAGMLGIGDLLAVMPARLSGGQAHRVALGRLLLAQCDALLLDEPYAGLDSSLRRALNKLVAGLVAAREVPTVLVAHELPDAQAFADRLAVLDRGRLLQVGAPDEVVLRPASRRVAELVGYLGFVPVRLAGHSEAVPASGPALGAAADGAPGAAPGAAPGTAAGAAPGTAAGGAPGAAAGGELPVIVAGVHPERVIAGAHPDRGVVLAGVITGRRPAGAGWEAELRVGHEVITCRLADRPGEDGGQLLVTAVDPPFFGPDGATLAERPAGRGVLWPEQVVA